MRNTKQRAQRRPAFTLIELIVVVGIILAVAALAAAFIPRVNDNTNLSRSVDTVEQVLLTAKLRAKRDQLATGVRFVQGPGDTGKMFSQFQYIQQPDPLAGGWLNIAAPATQPTGSVPCTLPSPPGPPPPPPPFQLYINGGMLLPSSGGTLNFYNVDFTLGGAQLLVQPGDFLEVRDGGVYMIGSVTGPGTLQLATPTAGSYDGSLTITTATTNYRILRQPRLLTGEPPVALPSTFVVDLNLPNNVQSGPSGNLEILFGPSGAVVGTNAGNGKTLMIVRDLTDTSGDANRMGIVGVQGRTGFIGAYNVAPGADPFAYVELGRESGL